MKFWGVRNSVFNCDRPIDDVYMPARRADQWSRVISQAQQNRTLQVVTAPSGFGKTTISKWLYHQLQPANLECFYMSLIKEEAEGGWLIPRLNKFLVGSEVLDDDIWKALAKGLDQLYEERRHLVMILDSIHWLSNAKAFDDILSFMDLNAENISYSFILFGSNEFLEKLKKIEQLESKVSGYWTIAPFSLEEMSQYINWCISHTEMEHNPFDPSAIKTLFQNCYGNPGRLNLIAENCLIESSFQNKRAITGGMVDQMAQVSSLSANGVARHGVPPLKSGLGGGQGPSVGQDDKLGTPKIQKKSLFSE